MKTLKHLFAIVLLLCSFAASAHDFEVDGIYYRIIDPTNQKVGVTFQGASYSEVADEYTGEVVIPESVIYNDMTYFVTSIDTAAFRKCAKVAKISLPNSIASIEKSAFSACSSLASITIPSSVTNITNFVFNNCTSLKEVYFEDSEVTLSLGYKSANSTDGGLGLFNDCPLETLYIGRNLSYSTAKRYGYSPFNAKSRLSAVTLSNNVTNIHNYMFNECTSLVNITIPNSVTSIATYAFYGCTSLANITIPNSVTSIGTYAFYGCTSLANITIPNSVTSIGTYAFYGCTTLANITIPNSVTSIGTYAFSGCTSLKDLCIEDTTATLSIADKNAFNECPLEHIYMGRNLSNTPFNASLISITIGKEVTSIANAAFSSCTSLKELIIAKSDKYLSMGYAYKANSGYVGEGLFY